MDTGSHPVPNTVLTFKVLLVFCNVWAVLGWKLEGDKVLLLVSTHNLRMCL